MVKKVQIKKKKLIGCKINSLFILKAEMKYLPHTKADVKC